MPRGQGRARHAALEPAQCAGDAAIGGQHAGMVVRTAKIAAFRGQPVTVACGIAVDRCAPAIFKAAALLILRVYPNPKNFQERMKYQPHFYRIR